MPSQTSRPPIRHRRWLGIAKKCRSRQADEANGRNHDHRDGVLVQHLVAKGTATTDVVKPTVAILVGAAPRPA